MKAEVSERLLIKELFKNSKARMKRDDLELKNIDGLTGDASTRRYYRLETNDIPFVVCLDHPSESPENSFVRMQSFLEENGVRVPRIYDMNLLKGYMLEEDLGNETLLHYLSKVKDIKEEESIYKNIVSILLKMHGIPLKDIQENDPTGLKFDYEKLQWEIDFTVDFFLKRYLKIDDEGELNAVKNSFKPVCERIASEKMVFTHRDFHSRNLMVLDDELVTIDFQDARLGIPQYDLVSVLEDCYYEIPDELKVKLIKHYYNSLPPETHGQGSFENFMSLYNDMLLQRVFKAIGSFSYIYETRKDIRYLKYIGFAMEKIRKCMFKDSKYDELRMTLFQRYYES